MSAGPDARQDDLFLRAPADVLALLDRQGALQPAGGLLYSEADTRNFHEMLFVIYQTVAARSDGPASLADLIRAIMSYYAARFRGWYGLEECTARIERAVAELDYADKAAFLARLERVMAVAGRINFWIDGQMPWLEINDTVKRTSQRA
jgi:hypothetical protein